MNKLLYLYLVLSISLFADNFYDISKINPSDLLSYHKKAKSQNIIVSDSDILKKLAKDIEYAKLYLKDMNKEENSEFKNFTVNYLSNKFVYKLLENEKKNLTEDILYSYYLTHKEKFRKDDTIDLYILIFNSKKDAERFNVKQKNLNNYKVESYKGYILNSLIPNYLLIVKNLEPNKLSDTFKVNDKYIKLYYNNLDKKRLLNFEEAKPQIINTLLNLKKSDLLEKALKSNKNEK